jgi:SPASM domain peptide maturase of grasp-with-spasm system
VFLLYACCVPVSGACRSSICDLQRGRLQLIPNGLYEILKEHRGETLGSIKAAYDNEYDIEIDEYFDFLSAHDLGFWCLEPELFPELDLAWESPCRITNAIIDADEASDHDYGALLRDLDDLGCTALQLRFFAGGRASLLTEVLRVAKGTSLRTIEILAPYHPEDTEEVYRRLVLDQQRISRIFIHGAPEDRSTTVAQVAVPIVFRRAAVTSPQCCGEVHPSYFTFQLAAFTESMVHNSCLNRKIAVDARGEIKNCPSLDRSFGNAREISLHSALARHDFKELWSINKDQIEICRDCEFRYVCTDCRAYLAKPEDRFSKPAKCNYDPYRAEWEAP